MVAAKVDNPPSADVLRYFLEIIANTAGVILLSLGIGLCTSHFAETVFVLAAFATIRFISGGYHLKASWACVIISTFIVSVIPFVIVSDLLNYIITAGSLTAMLVWAPANYDYYARISKRYYPLMKTLACAVVALNFVIVSDVLAITYIVQAALLCIFGGERT
ncbi:accessory gene regulator B family protein [Paenibacillus methanolicus]